MPGTCGPSQPVGPTATRTPGGTIPGFTTPGIRTDIATATGVEPSLHAAALHFEGRV
jgi:hypothetical protein